MLFFFTTIMLLASCNNKNLESKIEELKQINEALKDSISKINYNKIISSEMIILPSKVEGDNKFDAMIYNQLKGFNYDLYQLDTFHYVKNVTKKIIMKNSSFSQFQVKIDKNLIKNNTLYLLAEYNLDSIKVQIPGVLNLKN